MGTHTGTIKTAAKRIGVSVVEYTRRRAAGEKWCPTCKDWIDQNLFHWDESRHDGLASQCGPCRNRTNAERYARRMARKAENIGDDAR